MIFIFLKETVEATELNEVEGSEVVIPALDRGGNDAIYKQAHFDIVL